MAVIFCGYHFQVAFDHFQVALSLSDGYHFHYGPLLPRGYRLRGATVYHFEWQSLSRGFSLCYHFFRAVTFAWLSLSRGYHYLLLSCGHHFRLRVAISITERFHFQMVAISTQHGP
jgi:hypothetical protein